VILELASSQDLSYIDFINEAIALLSQVRAIAETHGSAKFSAIQ
jgi:hypothetical protein